MFHRIVMLFILGCFFPLSVSAQSSTIVLSSGNQSLTLDEQLKKLSHPSLISHNVAQAKSSKADMLPVIMENKAQINEMGQKLEAAFKKANKVAGKWSKAEQYMVYFLYQQAKQNQLILKQNNQILQALSKK